MSGHEATGCMSQLGSKALCQFFEGEYIVHSALELQILCGVRTVPPKHGSFGIIRLTKWVSSLRWILTSPRSSNRPSMLHGVGPCAAPLELSTCACATDDTEVPTRRRP